MTVFREVVDIPAEVRSALVEAPDRGALIDAYVRTAVVVTVDRGGVIAFDDRRVLVPSVFGE